MDASKSGDPGAVIGGTQLTVPIVTKCKDMDVVGQAGVNSLQATGVEEGVVQKVVVEVIPDDLAKLRGQLGD